MGSDDESNISVKSVGISGSEVDTASDYWGGAEVPVASEGQAEVGEVGGGVPGEHHVPGASECEAGGEVPGDLGDAPPGGVSGDQPRPKRYQANRNTSGLVGGKKDKHGNSLTRGAIYGQKHDLRMLALRLAEKDYAAVRRDVRRKLEVISLLYASKSKDGDEFRQASGMAIDLGGYKVENQAKAKLRAQKAEAKAARKGIKAARQAELGEAPKEVKF